MERCNWICHAFCLITNHYHLVIETVEANLSHGMRQLNGVYTQASNRRHSRLGHLFQGRFKAILVDQDAYLLELSRYVLLNPVRARMVVRPEDWPWSSYRAMTGEAPVPTWLAVDGLLSQFGSDRAEGCEYYRQFVLNGVERDLWDGLRQQIYLGDDAFVERMQIETRIRGDVLTVPRAQRRPPAPALAAIAAGYQERNAAIVAAYTTGAYSYREIAEYFGVHLATVCRIARRSMQQCGN